MCAYSGINVFRQAWLCIKMSWRKFVGSVRSYIDDLMYSLEMRNWIESGLDDLDYLGHFLVGLICKLAMSWIFTCSLEYVISNW